MAACEKETQEQEQATRMVDRAEEAVGIRNTKSITDIYICIAGQQCVQKQGRERASHAAEGMTGCMTGCMIGCMAECLRESLTEYVTECVVCGSVTVSFVPSAARSPAICGERFLSAKDCDCEWVREWVSD